MMEIVTTDLIVKAIAFAQSSAEKILKTQGMTWGPKWVAGHACISGTTVVNFQFGQIAEWDPKWGEKIDLDRIAWRKLYLTLRTKESSSTVINTKPWLIEQGEYLYSGAVYRDGIIVAVSGAKGWVDEAIAGIVIDCIIMLAHLETDRRVANNEMQI